VTARQQAEYEDRLAGKTIPAWKYSAGIWVLAIAVFIGRLLPDGVWWSVGVYVVAAILYISLLGPYRRRSLA